MNEYQIRVITPPTVEPVTLAECKADLRVDHTDDDTLITSLIIDARTRVETLCRRAFVSRTYEMSLTAWPCDNRIRLPYPPAATVTSVTYYDDSNTLQTMSASDYILIADVEPAIITVKRDTTWPSAPLRIDWPVRVRWVAGYGATAASVPDFYKSRIRALVAIRYENRDELTPAAERALQNVEASLIMEWGW